MSTSQPPSKEFLLFLLFIFVNCASSSQKGCTSFNANDYMGKDTTALHISYGDCSFKKTFCNYTQACTSGDAKNWITTNGGAVCPGFNGLYDSFSVLLSPLLIITQNTSVVFNYSQTTPGTLSVFIVTSTKITYKLQEVISDGPFNKEVNIEPGVVKIGFRARAAKTGYNVTLSYVKLQTESYISMTTASSTNDKSLTTSTGSTNDTSLTTSLAEAEATSGSNVGVTVGVVVAVVVVVAAGVVVGFFIWKRRKQRENRRCAQKVVKAGENLYQSANTRNILPATTGMPSQYNVPTNRTVTSANSSHEATPGISGISSNQYDVPRNGLPRGHAVHKYEQSRPSELTSPTGDDEQDCYNTIEEDSDRGPLSQSNVYCYARNEGLNTSSSNNPEGNYDRTDTHGIVSDWPGKSSSAPSEDDYNHIVSTDRPTKKTGNPWVKIKPNHILARGGGKNVSDEMTSRNDDDEYNVLCAGDKQLSEFNGQQAAGTYDHMGGDVHGDYDRIRQGDRKDVIGADYDHLV